MKARPPSREDASSSKTDAPLAASRRAAPMPAAPPSYDDDVELAVHAPKVRSSIVRDKRQGLQGPASFQASQALGRPSSRWTSLASAGFGGRSGLVPRLEVPAVEDADVHLLLERARVSGSSFASRSRAARSASASAPGPSRRCGPAPAPAPRTAPAPPAAPGAARLLDHRLVVAPRLPAGERGTDVLVRAPAELLAHGADRDALLGAALRLARARIRSAAAQTPLSVTMPAAPSVAPLSARDLKNRSPTSSRDRTRTGYSNTLRTTFEVDARSRQTLSLRPGWTSGWEPAPVRCRIGVGCHGPRTARRVRRPDVEQRGGLAHRELPLEDGGRHDVHERPTEF